MRPRDKGCRGQAVRQRRREDRSVRTCAARGQTWPRSRRFLFPTSKRLVGKFDLDVFYISEVQRSQLGPMSAFYPFAEVWWCHTRFCHGTVHRVAQSTGLRSSFPSARLHGVFSVTGCRPRPHPFRSRTRTLRAKIQKERKRLRDRTSFGCTHPANGSTVAKYVLSFVAAVTQST